MILLLSVGVLATVLAFAPFLREQWYIWRLSSQEEATRMEAAGRLGELKSKRAIPELVKCLRRNATEKLAELEDMAVHKHLWQPITLRAATKIRLVEALDRLDKVSEINIVLARGVPEDEEATLAGGAMTPEHALQSVLSQSRGKGAYAVKDNAVVVSAQRGARVPRYEPGWLPFWKGMWASDALAAIGEGAVPALVELLDEEEPLVRILALRTLARMGTGAHGAVSAVTALLDDNVGFAREFAAATLGHIGEAASEAVPRLEELRDDTNADLAMRAREALAAIRGE